MEMPGTPATPTRPNPDGLRISTPNQAGIPDQIRHSGSGLSANLNGLGAGKLSANYRPLVRPEGSVNTLCAVTVAVIDIDDYH